MKRLSIIIAIVFASIFIFDQASCGPVSKREADKSMIDSIKDMVSSIPMVGKYLKDFVQMIQDLFEKVQGLTNGGFGRVLGGAFPCTMSLDTGIRCTGVSAKSDMTGILKMLLDPIPGLMLPGIVKSMIYMMSDDFLVPTMDAMLGGVHKQ